jgi:sugar phosphate isomerase/epimerase
MRLNLAYSANAYMRFPLDEALKRIAGLGYRGVELMADVPHLWPQETGAEKLDAVRDMLSRLGLAISNVNAFMMNRIADPRQPYWHPSWIEPDRKYRRIRIEHTKAALTMADCLGAPHITTEPGGPVPEGVSWTAAMKTFVEELKPVIGHAEEVEVPLLVEPEPGLLIERFEQYLELRERIRSPFLGLNFDVGHAYCVSEEPAEWVPQMAAHTRHYHVEDIAGTHVHHHLVPGTGAIDFAATLRAIRDSGYAGWVTVELYPFINDPDAAGHDARAHLEKIAASL